MGLFDGAGFNLDPTTLTLASLAQAAAQGAMPSRMPVPTGAVLGNLAGGAVTAANTTADLDEKKLKTALLKAQIPLAEQKMQFGALALPMLKDILGNLGGGGAGPSTAAHEPTPLMPSAVPGSLSPGGALTGGAASNAPGQYAPLIQSAATQNGIPPDIFARQIAQESNFNPNAISPKGASGIAQFMPGTAERFAIDPLDPKQAIPAAAKYVAQNRDMFGGNLGLALAGYNWGEGNVQKWLRRGADPASMPAETRKYVANITGQPIDAWLSGNTPGSLAPPVQLAQAGAPPSPMPPAMSVPGSLAPGGVTAAHPPLGMDPRRLAAFGVVSNLAGMGDVAKPLENYYYQSPDYKASTRRAEKGVDLEFLPREEAIRQRSQYLGPGADAPLQGQIAAAKIQAEIDAKLDAAGIPRGTPERAAAARNMLQDTRPEAVRLADAANLPPDARGAAIAGAIPGNAPTPAQKESQVFLRGTPAEQAALQRAKELSRQQTTINNVTNPIAAGVGKSFVEQRDQAMGAVNSIRAIHSAREQVDSGIISGPGSDQRAFLARLGELFGVPAETAANTAAFKSAIGEQVLATVKSLGAGTSISNADRDFAERMAGGNTDLGEASIRRVLDIREKVERARIKAYSDQAEKLLKGAPDDTVKQIAPLLLIDQPPEYQPPQRQGGGAAPASPQRLIYDPQTRTLKPAAQ